MHRLIGGADDGPLCSHSDLPRAWCGHCREQEAAERARLRRQRPRGTDVYHRFLAGYPGTCERCGADYGIGAYIGVTLHETYVCEECC